MVTLAVSGFEPHGPHHLISVTGGDVQGKAVRVFNAAVGIGGKVVKKDLRGLGLPLHRQIKIV